MNIIFQDRFPVRTIVLIGVAFLITTQIYAQNADARLSLTLRNATLKEFVKRIENSTGYSFIYSEEITRSVISSPAGISFCKRKKNQKL